MRNLSSFEKDLIELIHLLSRNSRKYQGMTPREVKNFLLSPIASKRGKNALECLEKDGKLFINEIKIFLNEIED